MTLSPLTGFRCTACGSPSLSAEALPWDETEILEGAIACDTCRATFDIIWGTPFFGHYEPEDVLGLIEIAANARADNHYVDRRTADRLEAELEQYDLATDKAARAAASSDGFASAPWFPYRASEYRAFRKLIKGIDIAGRRVLDAGAGTGFDALRFIRAGGHVTALEYNPVLIRRGKEVAHEARWVGGLSHVLPFENGAFDIVCCNAALHHMRDVPAAIQEMLRVLSPGGWLLTTGDPFRSDQFGEELEFEVFNRHPDVLLGVNEGIPRFDDLVRTIIRSHENVDAEFFVSSGSLAMKAMARREPGFAPLTQRGIAIRTGEFAAMLAHYADAMAALVPLLPAGMFDRTFPGTMQTKFDLLNGWQKPSADADYRTFYKRARWFLTNHGGAKFLRVAARSERGASRLEVGISGAPATVSAVITSERWTDVLVPLTGISAGIRFACELQARVEGDTSGEFDDHVVRVRGLDFAAQADAGLLPSMHRTATRCFRAARFRTARMLDKRLTRLRGIYHRRLRPRRWI